MDFTLAYSPAISVDETRLGLYNDVLVHNSEHGFILQISHRNIAGTHNKSMSLHTCIDVKCRFVYLDTFTALRCVDKPNGFWARIQSLARQSSNFLVPKSNTFVTA